MYGSTFTGLHKWYNHKFEKLGWMVLASQRGETSKVQEYKRGIEELLTCLESSMDTYTDPDKRHDLVVLHMNAMELQTFVMKCL